MATQFTLDQIKEVAEEKYGSVIITLSDGQPAELTPILRMKPARRKQTMALLEELQSAMGDGDGDDEQKSLSAEELEAVIPLMGKVLKTAALQNGAQLVSELDDDAALIFEVFNAWQKTAQSGEAQDSQS